MPRPLADPTRHQTNFWTDFWFDFFYPRHYHFYHQDVIYVREMEIQPIPQRAPVPPASAPASSSSSSLSHKPFPSMPGDDDEHGGSGNNGPYHIGGPNHRNGPGGPPDDDDDGDEESGNFVVSAPHRNSVGGNQCIDLTWYQAIFSFVFGDGRPKCPGGEEFDTVMWTALGDKIRAYGGTVLAEECKSFLSDLNYSKMTVGEEMRRYYEEDAASLMGQSSSSSSSSSSHGEPEDDSNERASLLSSSRTSVSDITPTESRYMLPILAHFRGFPITSPDGRIVAYTFPTLVAQYHRLKEMDPTALANDSSIASYVRYVEEPMWIQSHCTSKQQTWTIVAGIVNLSLVSLLPLVIKWTGQAEFISMSEEEASNLSKSKGFAHGFLGWVNHIYIFLIVYAFGFFLIPFFRLCLYKFLNSRIAHRNARRQAWATMMRRPPLAFKKKLRAVRALQLAGTFTDMTHDETMKSLTHSQPSHGSSSSVSIPVASFVAASSSAPIVSTSVAYETVSRQVGEEVAQWERAQTQSEATIPAPVRQVSQSKPQGKKQS